MVENEYPRVLVKVSGDLFGHKKLDARRILYVADSLGRIKKNTDAEIAVMNGGGNLVRGKDLVAGSYNKAMMHYVGMIGTLMNALVLEDRLLRLGIRTRVMSSLRMDEVCEPYLTKRAIRHLEHGYLLILACGMGATHFTTDTAAIHRGVAIQADAVIKATKVDGVYNCDPHIYPDATKFKHLTFSGAMRRKLGIMDSTAYTLCRDNDMKVIVCGGGGRSLAANVTKAIRGEEVGTLITN